MKLTSENYKNLQEYIHEDAEMEYEPETNTFNITDDGWGIPIIWSENEEPLNINFKGELCFHPHKRIYGAGYIVAIGDINICGVNPQRVDNEISILLIREENEETKAIYSTGGGRITLKNCVCHIQETRYAVGGVGKPVELVLDNASICYYGAKAAVNNASHITMKNRSHIGGYTERDGYVLWGHASDVAHAIINDEDNREITITCEGEYNNIDAVTSAYMDEPGHTGQKLIIESTSPQDSLYIRATDGNVLDLHGDLVIKNSKVLLEKRDKTETDHKIIQSDGDVTIDHSIAYLELYRYFNPDAEVKEVVDVKSMTLLNGVEEIDADNVRTYPTDATNEDGRYKIYFNAPSPYTTYKMWFGNMNYGFTLFDSDATSFALNEYEGIAYDKENKVLAFDNVTHSEPSEITYSNSSSSGITLKFEGDNIMSGKIALPVTDKLEFGKDATLCFDDLDLTNMGSYELKDANMTVGDISGVLAYNSSREPVYGTSLTIDNSDILASNVTTLRNLTLKDCYIASPDGAGFSSRMHSIVKRDEASTIAIKRGQKPDDLATGIDDMPETAGSSQPLYNLDGIRVNDSYRGIVVRGGRKYVK